MTMMASPCIHCSRRIQVSYDHEDDCPNHPESDTEPAPVVIGGPYGRARRGPGGPA